LRLRCSKTALQSELQHLIKTLPSAPEPVKAVPSLLLQYGNKRSIDSQEADVKRFYELAEDAQKTSR
jgi:hypothetical protein